MKMRIATKLLVILLLVSLIPLLIVGGASTISSRNVIEIASGANEQIAELAMSNSTEALLNEQVVHLEALIGSTAHDVDEVLLRVQADTQELADFATYLYAHPESMGQYAHPSVYGWGEDKSKFGSIEANQNSWLAVLQSPANPTAPLPDALMNEIYLTEFLDLKFRSIAQSNPYAVQLYLNTKSQITRGMPFVDGEYIWVDATEQFDDPEIDVTQFDFYFLADEIHNPERVSVWTGLYWDPAGLGWMVSSIAPVYRGDELMGVVGIDITLGKLIDEIINLNVEQTGFAFLMSESGQAIAFPERAATFLDFDGELEGDFGDGDHFSHNLTDANDAAFQSIISDMQAGEQALTRYTLPSNQREYYLAYHPVAATQWSVGLAVPVVEIIAPAIETNRKIGQQSEEALQTIALRSQMQTRVWAVVVSLLVAAVILVAILFAKSISDPIRALVYGSGKIGEGELSHRIDISSGDEVEELADAFNQMASDLQAKVEEIKTANIELRKLDRLKSQFISIASHELRTPLIAIQGYVDLLCQSESGINDEQRKMLNTVSRNTMRLVRIVAELLDVSRIEENKLVLRKEAFSLGEVISEVADEQRPSFDERRHALTVDLQPALPNVLGDKDRIAQVLINLLGNAIKYTSDGGHIHIAAHADGKYVHLRVSDNGIGIKQEHMGQLFQRFSTVGEVTKHKTGKAEFMASGTGLGLSIVKGIVEAHQGEVWVTSKYGQGSTFHVTIPIADLSSGIDAGTQDALESDYDPKQSRSFVTHSEMQANQTRMLKVLVIDDRDDLSLSVENAFNGNYNILTASTSATGLKEAIAQKPHLIFLEAAMPGISGYNVCKALKRNSNTKEIPVIIFSANPDEDEQTQAEDAGADGFLPRPFKEDHLKELVDRFTVQGTRNE